MTPNMPSSGRVDVLAVLDRAVKDAQDRVPFMPPEGTFDADHQFAYEEAGSAYMELREARAAVAELIAADKAFDHAKARRIEADNRITRGDRTDEAFRLQASANHAYDRANARRAAAIANIGAAP